MLLRLTGDETKLEISETIQHLRQMRTLVRVESMRKSIDDQVDMLLDAYDGAPA